MKYCIVIGDGMADNPVLELGGLTPLEAAVTPCIDGLAARSLVARVRTIPSGLEPGSDTAILSICGYDPRLYYTGRAPLEAAGMGVSLTAGDVAYRCNMVSVSGDGLPFEKKTLVSHNGGSIDGASAVAMMRDLLAEPEFMSMLEQSGMRIEVTPSFRHIAVQSGVTLDGLTTAPPHDHLGEEVGPLLPGGCFGGALASLMRCSNRFLDEHPINRQRLAQGKLPANGLWFWAQGTVSALPIFSQMFGKRGFVVSAVPLVWGIGALAGLDKREVPGATGELDTNYQGKVDEVLRGLRSGYDFALLHVEAPDECTHAGDLPGKLEAIARLDSRVMSPLTDGLDAQGEEYRLILLSDHKTLLSTRGHDGEPVPYLLYDSRRPAPACGAARYTERFAENGLLLDRGTDLMRLLFELPDTV